MVILPHIFFMQQCHRSKLRHPNLILIMAVCCGPTSQDICAMMEPTIILGSLYHVLHCDGNHKLSLYEKDCVVHDVLDDE